MPSDAIRLRFANTEDLIDKVLVAYQAGNAIDRAGMISRIQLRNLAQALVSVARTHPARGSRGFIQAVVRIEEDQCVKLKKLAAKTKIPMAQLIRRSVDCALELHKDQLLAPMP